MYQDECNTTHVTAGKIGHWCGYLMFARQCQERNPKGICVLIQDDAWLSKDDWKDLRQYLTDMKPIDSPIVTRFLTHLPLRCCNL